MYWCLFEKMKINEKEAEDGLFLKEKLAEKSVVKDCFKSLTSLHEDQTSMEDVVKSQVCDRKILMANKVAF